MPRGQLPKLDPSIDLSRHLYTVQQLPEQIGSQSIFSNDLPLELEIGSGKGLYIQKAAKQRPTHNLIGVEIAQMYAAYSAAQLSKQHIGNAVMVAGDAQQLYARIANDSLFAVHIYFPDPWWKKKHKKRRVINESSVEQILRMLQPGGRLHFWTDVLDYFESAIEMIAEHYPVFGPPIPDEADETVNNEIDFRTHFERRSVTHSIPVYRIYFEKPCR